MQPKFILDMIKPVEPDSSDKLPGYQKLGNGPFEARLYNILDWITSKENYHFDKKKNYQDSGTKVIHITLKRSLFSVDLTCLLNMIKDGIEVEYPIHDIMEEIDVFYRVFFFIDNKKVFDIFIDFSQGKIKYTFNIKSDLLNEKIYFK